MLGYSVDCVDFVLFEFGVHLIVLIVCCVWCVHMFVCACLLVCCAPVYLVSWLLAQESGIMCFRVIR